jgi:hypothetical protein
MRKAIATAAIAAAASVSGCSHAESNTDVGPTVSRNYNVGSFSQLELAGHYDVDVKTGSKASVSARGPEKLMDRLVVEVRGDKLLIHPEKDRGWFGGMRWKSHDTVQVIVTVPTLSAATLAGSGGIKIDKIQGDKFDGQIAGSGDMNVGAIDVGMLKLGIAGSGGLSAGSGKAKTAEYEIAGSGGVNAGSVAVEQLKVSIAGSGDIKANATGTADVDIMGSGDVEVTGGAKCSVSKAGSGNVRCG